MQWWSFETRPVKNASFELETPNQCFFQFLLYQLPGHAIFFEFLVSVINQYHINKLHLFWDSFEWFCLQIRSEPKSFFFSCPRLCDRGFIIILSCHQHRYPWSFLATSPYRSSLPAGPQGYTPNLHIAAVCRFELVALLLPGYVKGSIGVHHLWARPYFSSSVLHVWFV